MPKPDFPLLTKESQYLLGLIYKHYLEAREDGVSRADARQIGSSEHIAVCIMPELSPADAADLMRELSNAGVVSCLFASDEVCDSELTNFGIIVMENRFKNSISDVVSFLGSLSAFIPQLFPNRQP